MITDRCIVPVDGDAPAGRYSLATGLYNLATMQRLPAFDSAGRRLDSDRLLLETSLKVSLP